MIGIAFELLEFFIRGSIILAVLFARTMVFLVKILIVVVVAAATLIAVAYKKRQATRAARTVGP